MREFIFNLQRFAGGSIEDSSIELPVVISKADSDILIEGTDRNDDLSNGGNTLAGGAVNYVVAGRNVTISGKGGNDTIKTYGNDNFIIGGTGDDKILLASDDAVNESKKTLILYANGDGNDTVMGFDDDDTLKILGATSSTQKSSSDIIVTVGDGSIILKNAANLFVADENMVNAVEGIYTLNPNDDDSLSKITTTEYDDTIENYVDGATLDAGAGNDSIYNEGDDVSINAGAANDSIDNGGGSNVTIEAGNGKDSITNSGDSVLIDGGAGKDSIYNSGDDVSISGGTGNDEIENASGKNVLFSYSAGDGNDTVYGFNSTSTIKIGNGNATYSTNKRGNDIIVSVGNGSVLLKDTSSLSAVNISGKKVDSSIISLTAGNDTYNNNYDNVTILALGGGDSITNSGDSVSIDGMGGNDHIYNNNTSNSVIINGGDGNDSIENSGDNITINGGAGDDRISNRGSVATHVLTDGGEAIIIDGGDGKDDISNSGTLVTILGSGGNDYISNYGYKVSIDGGDGNDYISNSGDSVTIAGGTGVDSIVNSGDKVLIEGGDGADRLGNSGNSVTIAGGAGVDSIVNSGDKVLIEGGDDNDTIHNNYGGNVTIDGGGDNDRISLDSSASLTVIEYSDGDGLDTVYGFNADDTLKIGDGNATYSTTKSGNDIIVNVGDGSVLLKDVSSLSAVNISGKKVESNVITLTEGDDDYSNSRDNVTILALGGNDSIINDDGNSVTIIGGSDNDFIYSGGSERVSIDGGAGDDEIYITPVLNSQGTIFSADNTVDGGAGNDVIYDSSAKYSSVNGGTGYDYIISTGKNNTLHGGKDDDLISLKAVSENAVIDYNEGDGNDTVYGFNATSTLKIGNGNATYSTTKSGNDILVRVGNGSVLLKNIASISPANVQGIDPRYGVFTENADTYSNTVAGATLLALGGNDSVTNSAANVYIDGMGGNDYLYNTSLGTNVSISGGDGKDVFLNEGNNVTITGGAGNDSIKNTGTNVTITGDAGADTVNNTGTKISVDTGDGNDYFYTFNDNGNNNAQLTVNAGDGSDRIESWGADNSIFDGGNDSDTLGNRSGYFVTMRGGNGNDTIDNYVGSNVTIDAGEGNDSIRNYYGFNVTIDAGEGNDTIVTRGGATVSINAGDGNDYIFNDDSNVTITTGTGNDTIKVGASVTSFTVTDFSAGDVIELNSSVESIGGKNTLTAGNVKINGVTASEDEFVWSIKNGVVTLTKKSTSGAKLSKNGKTITYSDGETETLFTLTGLKRGLTVEQLNKGITISGTTVTITDINILSTTNVSISGGYTLKLGGTVTQPTEITSGWKFDGTAVTYTFGGTTDGYVLENGRIVYKAATGGKTFTLTGLRSGVTIDRLNKGITISGTTVTVTDINLLSTTDISITDGYTLKFGGTVTQPTKITAGWSVNGTTATYTFGGTTDGYVIENGRIVYKPATGGETFTLTGLRSGVTIEQLTKGITISGTTVTITDINILPTTKVSITYGYKFEFDKGITQPTEIPASWSINGTTATYTFGKITDGYVLDEETNTIVYKKETSGSKFTLTGLREGVTVEQLTNGIKVDGTTIIIIDISILGTGTIRISGGYTPKFESDTEPKEISYGWSVNGTTATYTFGGMTDGYVLENGRIVYKKATGGGTFTLTGLRSGVTDEQLTNGVTISGKTVTITDVNLLSTTDVSITDDYTLKFGGTVTQPKEITAGWSVSGTTATYTFGGTTDGYVLENGRIVYKAKTGGETFTLTGLRNGVTIEQLNKGISISDTIVTVTDVNILSTGTLSITDGYRLALGESVKRPESVNSIWQIENGTTGKYYGTSTTDGYRLLNGIIDYRQAIFGNLIFTLTGLRSGVTTEQLTKYVTVDKKTLTVTPEVVGTNFATTTDYQIIFDKGDYSGSTFKVNDTGTYTIWLNGTRLNIDLSNGSGTYNFRSPNGGGNTFLVGTTRGKYNFHDFSNTDLIKLLYSSGTVTPTFQGGNVIFRINGITLTFPNIEGTGMPINIVDDTDTPLIDGTFYKDKVVDDEWISLSANYTGQSYTTEDIPNVDATAVGRNLTLIGGEENNEFIGGNGANLFNGGGGENILTGGKGNDTFVSGGGSDTITDYGVGNDKISLGAELSAYEVDEAGNLTLNVDSGSVTILDGVDKKITFVDGRKTTSQIFTAEGIWNTQKSAVTLSSDTEFFTSADAKKLVTIDGGRTTDVEIIGNAKNNKIFGGDSDDTLNGGAGKDTLTGGDGADVFVFERGKDVITDYTLDDKISLGAAVTNESVNNKGDVILKNGSNSLTVKKFSDNGQTINFADGTSKTYYKEKIVGSDGVTLSASFRDQSFTTDNKVDASLVGKRLTLTGGIENNTIIGGKGPDLLNGGGGENILIGGRGGDTFVNGGGDDTITDYEISDKISLMSAKSFELDGDNVIIGFENGSFTVKDGFDRKISFIEGGKTRVNIFATEGIFDGNKTAITLDAATEKFDANDYSKLVSIDGGLTNGVEIVGNKKANKIFAGNNGATIDGGKGNDSLWGGGGTDKFIYGSGGGKDVIFGFGNEDELQFSGEFTAAVKNNYIAFKVGSTNNAVTLKDFTATSFNVNGETYGVSGNSLTKVS